MSLNNELSNLSYTNKDFNSIYTELLEYAKKISYKWDPSASDESDPGVVLLKLAAIIGDKNSYNIDKNVLELMPASVTQLPAARQLFEQCGYSMRHYRSATGEVSISIRKHPEDCDSNCTYEIPMFTMLTDVDSSVIYSVIDTDEQSLKLSGDNVVQQSVSVIEGVAVEYTINNDPLITVANLDNKNRLYFTESNIAENGIFITNTGTINYKDWLKVDNLEAQKQGTRCYKFGLTLDGSICYIQFPEDAETLFGEGINIHYIRSSGVNGNVAARRIKNFYTDTKFKVTGSSQDEVTVTTDNFVISNLLPITNGSDPETIDEAYKAYKRVKDTFDTLVTLGDYTDYMVTGEYASNGYVCDRTNDIQHSYKILEVADLANALRTYVESTKGTVEGKDSNNELVEITVDVDSMSPYDLCVYALTYSPNPTTPNAFAQGFDLQTDIDKYIEAINTGSVKSLQHNFKEFEKNRILLIKNKYNMKVHVIPRYRMGTEQFEVQESIRLALYQAVNSNQLTFGDPVSYDVLYDTINNADERIKAASVSYPEYETYAVYINNDGKLSELRIDSESDAPTDTELWNDFRAEIFAKNVLSGVTPLYDQDTTFTYGVNQDATTQYDNVSAITTNTTIEFKDDGKGNYTTDSLRENENILLTAPNFIPEPNYPSFSSYVKMLFNIKQDITANEKHALTEGEYIIFFWKTADDNDYYDYIKYDATPESYTNIISPTFKLSTDYNTNVVLSGLSVGVKGTTKNLTVTVDGKNVSLTEYVKDLNSENNQQVLTGTKTINLLKPATITINNPDNGTNYIYWILNRANDGKYNLTWTYDQAAEAYSYTLRAGEYFLYANKTLTILNMLGEGTKLTQTIDTYDGKNATTVWSVTEVTYASLLLNGMDAISDWYRITTSAADGTNTLCATEMQQILLGEGAQLRLTQTDKPTALENKAIQLTYATSIEYSTNSNTWTNVEVISGNKNLCWSAQTILNLNMSPSNPQNLLSGQSITISKKTAESDTDENNSDPYEIITKIENKYVLSSIDLNLVGGIDINVEAYSLIDRENKPISLLTYTVPANVVDTDDKAVVTYDGETYTLSIPVTKDIKQYLSGFTVLNGEYLLHMTTEAPLANVKSLSVFLENVTLEGVSASIDENTAESIVTLMPINNASVQHVYKLIVNKPESVERVVIELAVECGITTTVYMQPLYKYTRETLASLKDAEIETNVISKIQSLDINKIFDYTYAPEEPIKNPLLPTSFHNKNHFYNKFTIDQWAETKDGDILVSTSLR